MRLVSGSRRFGPLEPSADLHEHLSRRDDALRWRPKRSIAAEGPSAAWTNHWVVRLAHPEGRAEPNAPAKMPNPGSTADNRAV